MERYAEDHELGFNKVNLRHAATLLVRTLALSGCPVLLSTSTALGSSAQGYVCLLMFVSTGSGLQALMTRFRTSNMLLIGQSLWNLQLQP